MSASLQRSRTAAWRPSSAFASGFASFKRCLIGSRSTWRFTQALTSSEMQVRCYEIAPSTESLCIVDRTPYQEFFVAYCQQRPLTSLQSRTCAQLLSPYHDIVNKQLADKERVAAALENGNLRDVVNQCLRTNG